MSSEIILTESDIIVSKTDVDGRITYVNRTFMRIANFRESQLLGQPHNIIRHPDMPKGVYRLLWKTIQSGDECFALVKNQTSDGRFYWVFAQVAPDIDSAGNRAGYFSLRRRPRRESIKEIEGVYQEMMRIERAADASRAAEASLAWLDAHLASAGTTYPQFIQTLD